MWVLMTKGAVSIVQFNHAPEGDPNTMQVRSRRREWLGAFACYMDRNPKLIHSDDKDYQWRFFASPDEVAAAVGRAVLDIRYSNFKNATSDRKFGLRKADLRHQLHDAYSKIWSTLLSAGDGTSLYDGKWGNDAGTIGICERLGHWWPAKSEACDDCGEPNPNFPDQGPHGVKPTKTEVEQWWKDNPAKKNRKHHTTASASAYNTHKAASTDMGGITHTHSKEWDSGQWSALSDKSKLAAKMGGPSSPTCPGSWLHAAKASLEIEHGVATGICSVCGKRVTLTLDTWSIRMHDKPVMDQVVDQILPPDNKPSLNDLEANRDAARDYLYDVEDAHAGGEASDDDLEEARDWYNSAETKYLKALGAEATKASA